MTTKETTDDTQLEDRENAATLEALVQGLETAPEPGELATNPEVYKGNADNPFPSVAQLKSAGHSILYDTRTGEPSRFNNNMIRTALKKTHPDGAKVFSARPLVARVIGQYKCFLHADSPDRKYYDTLGFAVCSKDNLASPYQQQRHMQKRHRMEWDEILKERGDKERAEDRAFQRLILEQAKPKEYICEECGDAFGERIALTGHMRSHKK